MYMYVCVSCMYLLYYSTSACILSVYNVSANVLKVCSPSALYRRCVCICMIEHVYYMYRIEGNFHRRIFLRNPKTLPER